MELNEKRTKMENLFDQQKEVLKNLNVHNLFESVSKIRSLELQKEIIKSIPRIKKATT